MVEGSLAGGAGAGPDGEQGLECAEDSVEGQAGAGTYLHRLSVARDYFVRVGNGSFVRSGAHAAVPCPRQVPIPRTGGRVKGRVALARDAEGALDTAARERTIAFDGGWSQKVCDGGGPVRVLRWVGVSRPLVRACRRVVGGSQTYLGARTGVFWPGT